MGRFKQYIENMYDKDELERIGQLHNIVPALKDPKTGKIMKGKRGHDHTDLMHRYGFNHEIGFVHTKSNKWISNDDTDLDSTDLMTSVQRSRYFPARLKMKRNIHKESVEGPNKWWLDWPERKKKLKLKKERQEKRMKTSGLFANLKKDEKLQRDKEISKIIQDRLKAKEDAK